jgi:hypothetical protein
MQVADPAVPKPTMIKSYGDTRFLDIILLNTYSSRFSPEPISKMQMAFEGKASDHGTPVK